MSNQLEHRNIIKDSEHHMPRDEFTPDIFNHFTDSEIEKICKTMVSYATIRKKFKVVDFDLVKTFIYKTLHEQPHFLPVFQKILITKPRRPTPSKKKM